MEPQDEDGGSRVPSPTAKKKDGLDDPGLPDAGPAPTSPDEAVDHDPNFPKGVSEESRPPGVDRSPNNGAPRVSVNRDNVAPQSGPNSTGVGPEADSIVSGNVAPVDGIPVDSDEVVQNPDYVAQAGVVKIPGSAVASVGVFNLGDSGPDAGPEIVELDRVGASKIEHPKEDQNPHNVVPKTSENAEDDCHVAAENNNNTAQEGTDTADEVLWSRAVAAPDCNTLKGLLAKDATYFWKYEKKNAAGSALHAAAAEGDLELAEDILVMLSWAEVAGHHDMRFSDTTLAVDEYLDLKRDGETAAGIALEKHHVAVEKEIRDYIAAKHERLNHDAERSRASDASSEILKLNEFVVSRRRLKIQDNLPEILNWNDAIKNKDCKALLEFFREQSNLLDALVEVEVKNGKGGRRTALQTAAMQGCFKLAKSMLKYIYFFRSNRCLVEYILARDEVSGLTAFEMANDVIGNRSIAEYIKHESFRYVNLKRMLHLNSENDNHRIEALSFDAYPGTRWYRALEKGDTRELKELVEVNSRFILETWHGLSVLHVAILWDDLELVKVVLNLFRNKKEDGLTFIHWGESYYPEKLSLVDMMSIRRNIDWVALRTWMEFPKSLIKQLEMKGNSVTRFAELLADLCPERRELLNVCTEAFQSATATSSPTPYVEHPTMPSRLSNFLKKYWLLAYDDEFKRDVDFNFEGLLRKKWLRFHFACKHPLKFKDFLVRMAFYIIQHPYDAGKLLHTWDGKGKTPFHIVMDHYCYGKDLGWPFDEIFKDEYFKKWIQIVESSRGKRIIDIILSKNYLQCKGNLLPWNYFKLNFNDENFDYGMVKAFLYYQVAFLLKQKVVVQEIWSRFLKKEEFSNVLKRDKDAFNSMLFLAASSGNQTCLQLLLDINQDPMIIDSYGRSLLHHAADPSILLSQLLGYCSLTVEDVSNVRRILMENNSNYEPQPSSSSPQDISLGERSNVGRKACILMLLQAGVDLGQPDKDGIVPTIGPTIDANYQSWWYDMVVNDSVDKKNALSQAGNALSVVGTLVAATSYVGPLQPPLSYDNNSGFVKTNEPLIKLFMVSNSLAFYLAMASVMFAVVSSLPMPQEGVISELNRAKHVISLSLCLLQIAIGSIIISYAVASIVAIENEQLFHPYDLLFSPSIIGWFFCLLGIGGFLIRLARLTFYKNRVVRGIYHFRFFKNISKWVWVVVKRPLLVILVVPFGIVFFPFWVILLCLEFIASKIPFLESRGIDSSLWFIRDALEDPFLDALLWF